jgi:hypothetical protein
MDKSTVVRTLNALWDYREASRQRSGQADSADAHERLLGLINRLEDRPASASPPVASPIPAFDRQVDGDTLQPASGVGSVTWRKQTAKAAANARHERPGGSRDKRRQIREIWATGKYSTRDICAEEECAALGMSFSSARKALRNSPKPVRSSG